MEKMPQALKIDWPRNDYSRVPFRLYHDQSVYALEMERVFRGPVWNYLALEAELPNAGDYRTTWIGDSPVVVTRAQDGTVHAFVNRCAHRGAQIVRRTHGNAKELVCIYHRWCYSLQGELIGIPFRRGLKGEGGMPADFDLKAASPRRLKVANFRGVLFGTFSDGTEPLEQYLGEFGTGMVERFMYKPVRVLGYSRQMVQGNWKLYAENLRDTYHASLLHEFFVTYGVDRATQRGGVKMDARHRHNMNHAYAATDTQEEARAAYAGTAGVKLDRMRLRDPSLLEYVPEFADGMNLAAPTFFPNMLLIQINNTLATRQIRPKAVDSFEIFQTVFGYADDSEEMTRHRLLLANLVGPAGFVSMEDGEAIEIIQKATRAETTASAVFEMGGRGPLKDLAHRVTETPIRGFWSYWSELMGVEPEGAIR
jgi:anthranilate 1,2-dioxygenase large subunit